MPLTQIEHYHRPASLDAAWRLLSDGDGTSRLLAGGTELVGGCPARVTSLVDLSDAGLHYIERTDDGGLRLGATSTFTELLEHPGVAAHATGAIAEMLVQLGSVLHRNSGTIGGHVVRSRCSDLLPVLLALDATVVTYTGAEAHHDVASYLAADLGPHVVVEVRLPPDAPGSATAFTRFSRTAFDYALVNSCCRVDTDDAGTVVDARVVVGESMTVGRRVPAAEQALIGAALTPDTIAEAVAATHSTLEMHGDASATADYRRHLAGVAVGRGLATVTTRLPGGAT
jgi:aerobic carbon-monoxide dehydrogenase medium subunit